MTTKTQEKKVSEICKSLREITTSFKKMIYGYKRDVAKLVLKYIIDHPGALKKEIVKRFEPYRIYEDLKVLTALEIILITQNEECSYNNENKYNNQILEKM